MHRVEKLSKAAQFVTERREAIVDSAQPLDGRVERSCDLALSVWHIPEVVWIGEEASGRTEPAACVSATAEQVAESGSISSMSAVKY